MNQILKFTSALIVVIVVSTSTLAQPPNPQDFIGHGPVNKSKENVALDGYDVVAYFKQDEARKGESKYSLQHEGVDYYFSSNSNRRAFQRDPETYLPEYGGFCAFGLGSIQRKFIVDPTSYKIVDDKLYLFFVGPIRGVVTDSQDMWNENEDELMKVADEAWVKQKNM